MISFKDFLIEVRSAPLYHGTNMEGLLGILRQNKISSGSYDSIKMHSQHSSMNDRGTISTSRDLKFAKYWSARISGLWMDDEFEERTVVIELDREKIRHRVKIIPYNHFPTRGTRRDHGQRWISGPSNSPKGLDGNQYEERLIGSLKEADKYIIKIHLAPEAREWLKRYWPDMLAKIDRKWPE